MSNKRILPFVLAAVAVAILVVPGKGGAPRRTLSVGMYCISLGHQRLECHFDVTGGTAPYTYQFTPTATRVAEDIGTAIIPCARAYSMQTVSLTVTDGYGETGSAQDTHFCGDAE